MILLDDLSHLLSLAYTLNIFHTFYSVSIVDFEHVNVCWKEHENENLPYFSPLFYLA